MGEERLGTKMDNSALVFDGDSLSSNAANVFSTECELLLHLLRHAMKKWVE
jgi:hypothetical protein